MGKLSVVIITKNEEKNIVKCIKALNFASEIIVVDSNSTDKTTELARENGATVYLNSFRSFSDQRNLGLDKTTNEWVLFVDADEVIDKKLACEIIEKIEIGSVAGYYLKRVDYFLGRKMKYGDLRDVQIIRLGKKSMGKWVNDVHEVWEIDGKVLRLKNPIIHNSHKNLGEFIQKINTYSAIRSKELYKNNENSNLLHIILYPKLKFIYLYFLKFGFKDGLHGFVHALFMSLYSFLVRAKLYQLINNGK